MLLAAVTGVSAQTIPADSETEDGWRYSMTVYGFLPAQTQGKSIVADGAVDLDLNFSEALDILDFALSARGEAWNGDWGAVADFYTVNLGLGSGIALPGPAGGRVDVNVDVKQTWASLLAAYRFSDGTYGNRRLRYAWDVSAGARWNRIKQEINAAASVDIGPGFGRQTTLGGTEQWLEPMIGIRAAYEVADRWTLGGRVELGGFGVEGDDLQYTVLIGADWQAWDKTSLKFGYQWYGIDYSTQRPDGEFAYNIDQNGPYVGLTFRF